MGSIGPGPGSAGVSPASSLLSEWRSRGYLPHRDALGLMHMVTFRLADSLPAALLEELRTYFPNADADRREQAETYLDAGHGAGYLRDPAVACMVERALLHHDGERYRLLAWSIMPNHVHVLLGPLPGHTLAKVLHSWKSYTAHAANQMLGRSGAFWQREYWDRYIRDDNHLNQAIRYMHEKNRSRFSSAAAETAAVPGGVGGRRDGGAPRR